MPTYHLKSRLFQAPRTRHLNTDKAAEAVAVRMLAKESKDPNDEVHVYREKGPHREPKQIGYAAWNQMGRLTIWIDAHPEEED